MIQTKFLLVMFVGLTWLIIAPLTASAQWFVELYGGAAYTQSEDVTDETSGVGITTWQDVDFDMSFPVGGRIDYVDGRIGYVGGRIGYWNTDSPWAGLALDAFHFRPNIDSQTVTATTLGVDAPFALANIDLSVTAISLDVMFRSPKGFLQPYLAAGPAIFLAVAEDTTNFSPANQSDADIALGVKVGAGLALRFHKNFALFAEYRFTYFSPKFKFNDVGPPATVETLETNLYTHHLVGGISFSW